MLSSVGGVEAFGQDNDVGTRFGRKRNLLGGACEVGDLVTAFYVRV
jgi:hypothetical protein